jgi:hypothetical protein
MREATDWDLWKAGLIGGPEPRGRRPAAELDAMRAEHDRNVAIASFNLNKRWEAQHGPSQEPYRSNTHYQAVQLLCERLGIGSD